MKSGKGKYKISLTHSFIGKDLLVIITGGVSHIGAVSLSEKDKISTVCKKLHKDDIITSKVAPLIYDSLGVDTLVVCGIHLDNATKNDIKILVKNAKKCVNKFLKVKSGQ